MTVSITVELPASGTIADIEPRMVVAGPEAMRAAVQAACREHERQIQRCPHCRRTLLQSEGSDERQVQASFGRVRLHLRRLRCEACGHGFRPADAFLASLAGCMVTGRLRSAWVLAGSSPPYQTAARVLHDLCGAEISDEWVRHLTNDAGSQEAHTQREAARALVAPALAISAGEREAYPAQPQMAAPEELLFGLDGGWIPSREQAGGWKGKSALWRRRAKRLAGEDGNA